MPVNYNINTLFEIAFGLKSVAAFNLEINNNNNENNTGLNYDEVTIADSIEEASRLSYLGTPIIFPITFKGKAGYQIYNSIGEIELKSYQDFELPAATLVNFRRPKIIRRTKIPGGSGTVKELYGADDWSIDIRGICLADPSHAFAKTAMQQHEALVYWANIFDSIKVQGDLFANKGIEALVIEDINFTQLQGKPGLMPFTIRAKSDTAEEHSIINI